MPSLTLLHQEVFILSFQLTINKNESEKFKIIAEEYNEFNYITIDEEENKIKLQIVLFNEEKSHKLQEALMEYLGSIHIEEIIGGG